MLVKCRSSHRRIVSKGTAQLAFTDSRSATERLEKEEKYVLS